MGGIYSRISFFGLIFLGVQLNLTDLSRRTVTLSMSVHAYPH